MTDPVSSAITALSAPVTKLIDVVASGVGEVWRPYQVRRMARAHVAATHIEQLGTLEMQDLIQQRLIEQELRRLKNVSAVADGAIHFLPDQVTAVPVSQDWSTRFFSLAQDISSEELQILWSKILAGEVTRPGSFSLRALTIVHDLTIEEATAFNQICLQCFELEGNAYPLLFEDIQPTTVYQHEDERIELGDQSNIDYAMYQDLEGAGLLHFEPSMIFSKKAYTEVSMQSRFYRADFQVRDLDATKRLPLGIVRLSRAGLELMRLAQGDAPPPPRMNRVDLLRDYGWHAVLPTVPPSSGGSGASVLDDRIPY